MARWSASKHPRGKGGKFSKSGGGSARSRNNRYRNVGAVAGGLVGTHLGPAGVAAGILFGSAAGGNVAGLVTERKAIKGSRKRR